MLTGTVKDTLADGSTFWLSADGVENKRTLTAELRLFLDFELVASEAYDSQWYNVGRTATPGQFFGDCAGAMQQSSVASGTLQRSASARRGSQRNPDRHEC